MEKTYAQAFLQVIKTGTEIEVALLGLKNTLLKKGYKKLLLPILHEVVRIIDSEKSNDSVSLVFSSADTSEVMKIEIKAALAKLGTKSNTSIVAKIDETLIGGFVATYNYTEHDQSYKRVLKSLYDSITV